MSRRIRWSILATAAVAVLLLFTAGAWHLSRSRSLQLFGEFVTSVETGDSLIALTFDDGPGAYTDAILDLLRKEGVPATFFVIGSNVERDPTLARRMVLEGHELGNHSYSHRRMVLKSQRFIRHEVETTDSLIRAAGHRGPIHFRPPYGKRLVGLPWYLSRTGRTTVFFSLEPDSWFGTREEMTDHVLANAQPGAIVLLHVEMTLRAEERAALRSLIPALRARGYRFATVSDLMRRGD